MRRCKLLSILLIDFVLGSTGMSISNNATGEMICEQRPTYGGENPADPHSKFRKGTSRKLDRFEELGYIAVPPCLWGSAEHGLDPPPNLEGLTLRIVKTSNATYGHHGEVRHYTTISCRTTVCHY